MDETRGRYVDWGNELGIGKGRLVTTFALHKYIHVCRETRVVRSLQASSLLV